MVQPAQIETARISFFKRNPFFKISLGILIFVSLVIGIEGYFYWKISGREEKGEIKELSSEENGQYPTRRVVEDGVLVIDKERKGENLNLVGRVVSWQEGENTFDLETTEGSNKGRVFPS